jgi:hypothetical protein
MLASKSVEFLPPVDNWGGIDFRDTLEDTSAEFLPGLHSDVPQKCARHLSK